MTDRRVEGLASRLLKHLPSDGSAVGNTYLRRKLKSTPGKFTEARNELVQKGYVELGKGRGGSIRLLKKPSDEIELPPHFQELASLVRSTSQQARAERVRRRNPTTNDDENFENQVWRLVYSLKPSHITVGRKPELNLPTGKLCPDVVAICSGEVGQVGILVECKFSSSGPYPTAYLADWISKIRTHRAELKKLFLEKLKLKKFLIVAAVNDVNEIEPRIKSEASQIGVKWFDAKYVSYFQKIHEESGIGIGHTFWTTVAPDAVNQVEKNVPAIRIKTSPGSEAYIFSANAHDLLARAYVSHRELDRIHKDTAYQRMFKKAKIKAIEEYIKDKATFPTPIVIVFDEHAGQVFDKDGGKPEVDGAVTGRLRLPNKARSMQVIDGQHRLYGYTLVDYDSAHMMNVVAYRANSELDPARLFVDINAKQTPVPTNLLWELYPDIYSEEDPLYYKAMISQAVEKQISEHLMGRVKHISLHSEGDITFQTICREVERLKLVSRKGGWLASDYSDLESRQKKLSSLLDAFFTALKTLETEFPLISNTVIFTNVGLIPMIRIFGRIIRYEAIHHGSSLLQSKQNLVDIQRRYFIHIYKHYEALGDDAIRQMISGKSSEGGFNILDDELTSVIKTKFRADFPARQSEASPAMEQSVNRLAGLMEEINQLALRSSVGQWIFRELDKTNLARRLKKREFNEDSFQTAIRLLHQEVIEASAPETGSTNHLFELLGISKIDQIPALDEITAIRNYHSHKKLRDKERMLRALRSLKRLSGRTELTDQSDLGRSDFETILIAMMGDLTAQVLEPALQALKTRIL